MTSKPIAAPLCFLALQRPSPVTSRTGHRLHYHLRRWDSKGHRRNTDTSSAEGTARPRLCSTIESYPEPTYRVETLFIKVHVFIRQAQMYSICLV